MSKGILVSAISGTVFATTGMALPVIVALITYIGLRLKNVALTPPAANRREPPITSSVGLSPLWSGIKIQELLQEMSNYSFKLRLI